MLARFASWFRFRVSVAPWSRLPAPVWAVVASPLLSWALCAPGSRRPWFRWPAGCSCAPWRLSFWWVGAPAPGYAALAAAIDAEIAGE